jgi:hypothetical protein
VTCLQPLFALVIFWIGSRVYAPNGLDLNLIYTSSEDEMTGVVHHTQLLFG